MPSTIDSDRQAAGLQLEGRRTTSTLNDVNNDTGRVAFCGPVVISAVTGHSVSKIEAKIRHYRELPAERKPIIRGTYTDEVEHALMHYGYRMHIVESYMHEERKARRRSGHGCKNPATPGPTTFSPSIRARKVIGS